ncbi:MAG: DEAD/DEAH box helicase family protein [Promethearchaeota archaeon]
MLDLMDKKDYKFQYTQGWDNLIEDFFIPTISLSSSFDYISGYFSSKLFIPLFIGLKKFIVENDGRIRLLVGVPLGEDFDVINSSKEELEKKFIEIYEDEFILREKLDHNLKEHLKLLAWLLYRNRIEIRWGIPVDENGKAIQNKNEPCILHEKIGIFSDGKNYVTFSGSANMTYSGWLKNREEIKVFKSWDETRKYAEFDKQKFNIYWENRDQLLKVFRFPIKFKNKIIKIHKINSIDNIDFTEIDIVGLGEIHRSLIYKLSNKLRAGSDWIYEEGLIKPQIELDNRWNHQKEAIEYLKNNNYRGFLSMATGTGKTRTAIFASYSLYKNLEEEKKNLLIIIGVPDIYLVKQWADKELSRYTKNVIKCYSENPNWKKILINEINKLKLHMTNHLFIVGTYKTLNSNFLNNEIFNRITKNIEILFIGDEAHYLGAPTGRYLIENFKPKYRIGLSATPYRYFDEEGTQAVLSWFLKKDIAPFEFNLKDAQKLGTIMKFQYHFSICNLSDEEFQEFIDISKQISKIARKNQIEDENNHEFKEKLELLLFKRADKLKKSINKLEPFKKIIIKLLGSSEEENKFWRTIIYCKDREQRYLIENILRNIEKEINRKIRFNFIDGDMNVLEREQIIKFLTDKKINAIIAMKCLDRGVDIPSLEKAIFLASSGSELEHIQRAGRILRKSPGKKGYVNIYDIIVLPKQRHISLFPEFSKKIYEIERRRISFFVEFAENNLELETDLFNIEFEKFH